GFGRAKHGNGRGGGAGGRKSSSHAHLFWHRLAENGETRMTKRALSAAFLAASLAVSVAADGMADRYQSIDGGRLKGSVGELAAMARDYRDHGHAQFWGRIIGTDADAANARWLAAKFTAAGLAGVREQPFDLPPQWMPQAWSVAASAGGNTR